jgi:D-amino-acid dehydrogenase
LAEVIEREGLVVEWQARGTYTAYLDPLLFERERQVHDEMAEFGVRFEVLDRLALRRRIPTLRADVVGGIYAPDDAFLRPDALCRAWLAANRRLGVEICEGVRVEMLRPQDDGIELDTDRGVERASRVILALGAWSRALADRLGVRLPIEPGKGYSITLPKPVGASDEAILLKDVSVCYTPWSNQIRLGSTMEFTGFDPRLNAVRLEALRRGAGRFLSLTWGPESGEAWCGFRPMVYDELPIIGALPRERRVVVAAGHGMLGLSMSAATGRLAAELLLGAEPHVDPTPYRLERFT